MLLILLVACICLCIYIVLEQKVTLIHFICRRIHKDLVDPEKLQATLTDETLNKACDLKKSLEMVTLLEAQLKEMNPNLDSIAEYVFPFVTWILFCQKLICLLHSFLIGTGERSHCTMNELGTLTQSPNSGMMSRNSTMN